MNKSRIKNVIVETFQMNRLSFRPIHPIGVFSLPSHIPKVYSNFEIFIKKFKYQTLLFEHRHTLKFKKFSGP